jgi:hypothetical protein
MHTLVMTSAFYPMQQYTNLALSIIVIFLSLPLLRVHLGVWLLHTGAHYIFCFLPNPINTLNQYYQFLLFFSFLFP